MNTIYVLGWHNGMEYGDAEVIDLGYYSSQELREQAKVRYAMIAEKHDQWPFLETSGGFVEREEGLDVDIIVDMRKWWAWTSS